MLRVIPLELLTASGPNAQVTFVCSTVQAPLCVDAVISDISTGNGTVTRAPLDA